MKAKISPCREFVSYELILTIESKAEENALCNLFNYVPIADTLLQVAEISTLELCRLLGDVSAPDRNFKKFLKILEGNLRPLIGEN